MVSQVLVCVWNHDYTRVACLSHTSVIFDSLAESVGRIWHQSNEPTLLAVQNFQLCHWRNTPGRLKMWINHWEGLLKVGCLDWETLWSFSVWHLWMFNVLWYVFFFTGTCPEPGGVPFSSRTRYNGPYNPGSQVTYSCHDGNVGTITCQSNGGWTQKPVCSGEFSKTNTLLKMPVFLAGVSLAKCVTKIH